jgi:hypothetical protein
MDPYEDFVRKLLRLAGKMYFEWAEGELRDFGEAVHNWLYSVIAQPTRNWREGLNAVLAEQEAKGRILVPASRQALIEHLQQWEATVDWNALASQAETERRSTADDRSSLLQPSAALRPTRIGLDTPQGDIEQLAAAQPPPSGGRGDQSQFAREAEEIVSDVTGLPRNEGPRRQKIPGSGKKGFRIPDFPVRGPQGSVRQRGTIIEVKASRDKKFGKLSGLSRQQIRDAVEFVRSLRDKASLVKDPTFKSLLENAHVEVFSDLPQPTRGEFWKLMRKGVLDWKAIPRSAPVNETLARGARSTIPTAPRSPGKPGVGTAANFALGIVASLAEAGVADAVYRDAASVLKDLLQKIEKNGDASDQDWAAIEEKLKEITNMKQSTLGYLGEVMTYGQGSLKEKQAMAMMSLAFDLGKKFGYQNKRTWGDIFQGRFGRFEKKD